MIFVYISLYFRLPLLRRWIVCFDLLTSYECIRVRSSSIVPNRFAWRFQFFERNRWTGPIIVRWWNFLGGTLPNIPFLVTFFLAIGFISNELFETAHHLCRIRILRLRIVTIYRYWILIFYYFATARFSLYLTAHISHWEQETRFCLRLISSQIMPVRHAIERTHA